MDIEKKKDKSSLWKYAGLTFQIMAAIGLSLFGGIKIDNWLNFSIPSFTWILPLFIIIAMIVRVVIDTNKK